MNIFKNYAHYYDLLYKDKDYKSEINYVEALIKKYSKKQKTVLDLGCGTGNHAELLAEKYQVVGVDISEQMILLAKEKIKSNLKLASKLDFICGDIRDIKLNNKFDIVLSLFHVVSYQITNEDLIKTFLMVKEHLNVDGIFIFDCWYGPAVLTQKPSVKIKRFEDKNIEVIRIAEPKMHYDKNFVDVNYQVFVKEKSSKNIKEFKEEHKMRYLFKPEIKLFFERVGLELLNFEELGTGNFPSVNSWGVCFVARKSK